MGTGRWRSRGGSGIPPGTGELKFWQPPCQARAVLALRFPSGAKPNNILIYIGMIEQRATKSYRNLSACKTASSSSARCPRQGWNG